MGPDEATPDPDVELIATSVEAPDRFGELYDRHVDAVLAFHVRRTGCAHTAADLTAETFAAAFTSRHRFRDVGVPARAWLFTIARRQLSRYIRREQVDVRARRRLGMRTDIHLDTADVERIEALIDAVLAGEALRRALEHLPAPQAEAVWLRVGHELPYPEVAARLGCSEGAARVRVSRGLVRLTDAFEEATR